MKAKDDVFIPGEVLIVVRFAQAVRVLRAGLLVHQIDDIDDPDFSSGKCCRRMETAAKISSVGVSPQQAITTSGSAFWSLLAHCQMPIPSVQ